jgi:copper transport protein
MPSEARDLVLHIARWAGLVGMLLAAGVVMFGRIVWRSEESPHGVQERFAARSRLLLLVLWMVSVLATLVALLAEPGYAQLDVLRLALVAIPGCIVLPMGRRSSHRMASPRVLESLSVAGLVLAAALAGHVRGSSPMLPNLSAAVIHVAGGAAWAGGLVTLLGAALPASRSVDPDVRAAIMAPVVARFSNLAVASVVAVITSGVYSSWVEVRTLGGLTGSAYGMVLLAKLGTLVPILAIGAINNRWTTRRLLRAAASGASGGADMATLRRLVAWEVALLAALVGLTALLLSLSPPVRQL